MDPQKGEKPKIDYSEKILTPLGTKKDVDKKIEQLLEEIRMTDEAGERRFWKKMVEREKVTRKASEPRYISEPASRDMPIDGDHVKGSSVYMINCAGCHSLDSNSQGKQSTGPALGLIYGRRAGSDKHYDYSEALSQTKVIWSERNLFNFMKAPGSFIKGCKCEIPNKGLADENDRADLAKFLKLFTKQMYINQRIKANQMYGKDYVHHYELSQKRISEENFKRMNDLKGGDQRK